MKDLIYFQIIRILNKEVENTLVRINYHEFGSSEDSRSRSIYIKLSEDDSVKVVLEKRYNSEMKLTITGASWNEFSFTPSAEQITEVNYILDKLRKIAYDKLLAELIEI